MILYVDAGLEKCFKLMILKASQLPTRGYPNADSLEIIDGSHPQ